MLVNLVGEVVVEAAAGDAFELQVKVRGSDASRDLVGIETEEDGKTIVKIVFPVDREKRYIYPPLGRSDATLSPDDGDDGLVHRVLRSLKGDRIKVSGRGKGLEVWADVVVKVPRGATAIVRLGVGRIDARDDPHQGRFPGFVAPYDHRDALRESEAERRPEAAE